MSVTAADQAPGAPVVTVTPAGRTSLDVSWTEPTNTGTAIVDYDVQYRRKTVTTWTDHAFTGTDRSTTIRALGPGTVYQVQVRAGNNLEGNWSAPVEASTPINRSPNARGDTAATPLAGTAVARDGDGDIRGRLGRGAP